MTACNTPINIFEGGGTKVWWNPQWDVMSKSYIAYTKFLNNVVVLPVIFEPGPYSLLEAVIMYGRLSNGWDLACPWYGWLGLGFTQASTGAPSGNPLTENGRTTRRTHRTSFLRICPERVILAGAFVGPEMFRISRKCCLSLLTERTLQIFIIKLLTQILKGKTSRNIIFRTLKISTQHWTLYCCWKRICVLQYFSEVLDKIDCGSSYYQLLLFAEASLCTV